MIKSKIVYIIVVLLIFLLPVSDSYLSRDIWCRNIMKPLNLKDSDRKYLSANIFAGMLGFKTVAADFKWMETIQYIGDSLNEKEQYGKFYGLVKETISLDHNFTYAYSCGSAILIWQLGKDKEGLELIREGIAYNPDYWQLNLYLAAFTYYKSQEYKKVIVYIEEAVMREGHPPMLERILGNFYVKTGEIKKAGKLWWWMFYNSTDTKNKQYAEEHLKKYGFWN